MANNTPGRGALSTGAGDKRHQGRRVSAAGGEIRWEMRIKPPVRSEGRQEEKRSPIDVRIPHPNDICC